jgi:hypothetical protein
MSELRDTFAAVREMSGENTRETLKRIHDHYLRQKSDQRCDVPLGFKYIDTAPHDGTFIRLQFNPLRLLDIQHPEMVGQFRIEEGGKFCGWFNKEGEYLPWPLFWAPVEGAIS